MVAAAGGEQTWLMNWFRSYVVLLSGTGVQMVIDAVVDYLPSPLDIPPVTGIEPDSGES